MKKMTSWVAVLAAMATFSMAGQVHAQATGTRVAVVNIGTVFTKYEKAKAHKTEMEGILKPFKDEAEKIKKNVVLYQDAHAKATDAKQKEGFEQALRTLKRQLEDLDMEARKRVVGKQEQNLIHLYKEVSQHIQAVAQANGIHVVLGYGEPPDGDLYSFVNINRKLSALDMGSSVPLYFHASLDISDTVVASLNRSYAPSAPATNITPTSGQK